MKRDISEASGEFLGILLAQREHIPSPVMVAALELVATLNAHQLRETHVRQSHLRDWAADRDVGSTPPPTIRVAS